MAVQGSRYEGYMVLVNALVESAGGHVIEDPETGRDVRIGLTSRAGHEAATVLSRLARVAPADVDTATEEEARNALLAGNGGFGVNWPYLYGASADSDAFDDLGWARYPRVDAGRASAPPLGGIHIGVGSFGDHQDLAVDAARCITSVAGQTTYMLRSGNPAAAAAVYDNPEVREQFPMADLIRQSIDEAGPRPASPFYNDVSAAVVDVFHPLRSVDPHRTPSDAAHRVDAVLHDEELL